MVIIILFHHKQHIIGLKFIIGLQGLLDIGYTQEELPELNSVVIEQQVIDFQIIILL